MAQHYGHARASAVRRRHIGALPIDAHGSSPIPSVLSSSDTARDLYWQCQTDRHREPMALLDTTGRVIRTSLAFDEAMNPPSDVGAALELREELMGGNLRRLRAVIAADQAALDAAIARAVREEDPVAAAVRCSRRDGGSAVVVTFQPLPWTSRITGPAAATLRLIDPLTPPKTATRLWCEAFELTPSEASVASLLVAGHSVESAAAARGSRVATLRVHLRNIFLKTCTARQSDLVALLLRIG